jgi:hypothetical protein
MICFRYRVWCARTRWLGEKAKAEDAMARLLFVAADADPGLAIVSRAMATGITATPRDSSPGPQRNYMRTALEKFGPNKWEPYAAPLLDVKDSAGKRRDARSVQGEERDSGVLPGPECAHCMKQLHDIGSKKDEWEKLDTVVLAVSSAAPEKNARQAERRSGICRSSCYRTIISRTRTGFIRTTILRRWNCIRRF